MFYIFEMANNHQGSVAHAKLIIDKFSSVAKQKKIDAAIKLQFRQLDSFIHKDFKKSDLKFVKRFNSTRLTKKFNTQNKKVCYQWQLHLIMNPYIGYQI